MGKYTQLFIDETRSYLETMHRTVEAARSEGAEGEPLSEGSRLAHSIKGMALFEEQPAVADLACALERGFASAGTDGGPERLLDGLAEGMTLLRTMIDEVDREGTTTKDPGPLVEKIERASES